MPCNLIDGWGVGVQVALGFLAFSSLALKRWCERPRRPLKIWYVQLPCMCCVYLTE